MTADELNRCGMDAVVRGDFAAGIACFGQALTRHPLCAGYHANLGIALMGQANNANSYMESADEALQAFHTALRLDDSLTELHGYLGTVYGAIGQVALALHHLALAPDSFYVLHRRQVYLYENGQFADSMAASQQAIALRPDDAVARYNHAVLLLTLGDLKAGWQEFEWRHKKPESMAGYMQTEFPSVPEWQGEDISDQHLLLLGEMGFGDMIQFARFIPHFAARCRKLSVFVPDPLRPLLRANYAFSKVTFCETLSEFDCYTWMMSAGRHFRLHDFRTVPWAPYLYLSPEAWTERFSGLSGLKVGLIWSGRTGHIADARRSIAFATIATLFDLPCSFVSLQKHALPREVSGEARYLSSEPPPDLSGYPVYDAAPALTDWSATAQAMQALDVIISVDTAAAHLAGALGRPVFLINRANSCWRWGQHGEFTPWYPSMRIFRQTEIGDWQPVMAAVRGALLELIERL